MLSNVSFISGVLLFVVALFLIRWLLRKQQEFRQADPEMDPLEARFNISQCRRRLQCGVMLAALAVGVMVESWIDDPRIRVLLGAAMLFVLGWMVLLAILDIVSTNLYYQSIANRYRHEQMRLEAKVKDLLRQGSEGNGSEEGTNPEGDEEMG